MRTWLKRLFYRAYYHRKSVKIGAGVVLNTHNYFEGLNVIGNGCEVASSHIGLGTYISDNSIIRRTSIGRFCSIGSNIQTGVGLHPSKTFVSTHPSFFSTQKQAGFSFVDKDIFEEHKFADGDKRFIVEIGNDVWVGSNVIFMDGVKVGDGAIVAAGAIVTTDVLPYAIVAGVPAKFKRLRFSEDEIAKLVAAKWWDWELEKIKTNSALFSNIELFAAALDKKQ